MRVYYVHTVIVEEKINCILWQENTKLYNVYVLPLIISYSYYSYYYSNDQKRKQRIHKNNKKRRTKQAPIFKSTIDIKRILVLKYFLTTYTIKGKIRVKLNRK